MNGLPKPCYVMSEPHLSGYRVVLGYETLNEAQDAQATLAASPPAREEAPAEGAGEVGAAYWRGEVSADQVAGSLSDIAAKQVANRLRDRTSDPAREAVILKGVGKINGDGWKDTTVKGEIVFVWNSELPSPYAPGQYPRIGNEGWSASTAQYDFAPASLDEVRALFIHPTTDTATADKLRVAKEALERIERKRQTGAYDGVEAWELQDIARQALAALNEEG